MTDIRDEWRNEYHSLNDLDTVARKIGDTDMKAMDFLVIAGVLPQGAADRWRRTNALPRLGINPARIPAEYLAEVAFDWDILGVTSPNDFIEALSMETAGHDRDVVIEALARLGRENLDNDV